MTQTRPRTSWALTGTLLWTCGASAARAMPPLRGATPPLSSRASSAPPSPAAPGSSAPLDSPPPPAPIVVVAIDPGHGGTNLGAAGPGPGVYEKRLMLALAERVRALLTATSPPPAPDMPGIVVRLCRDSDAMVPIRARARCARESGAVLFLSLHANAVPAGVTRGSQRGFEVFLLGPRELEDDAALAALGQASDADAVWAAHEVRAAGERSLALARLVTEHMTQELGGDARRGIKQFGAALDVLRGAGTAAALVEVGFIDHPQEGAALASPAGREPIARALAAAIRAYVRAFVVTDATPTARVWRRASK